MHPPGGPTPDKEAPKSKPSRQEEALRIIEEYAAALREIIIEGQGVRPALDTFEFPRF